MTNRDLNIAYMGTPEFAVPSLKRLIEEKYNVVAVVTSPDKAAGRGLKTRSSAIKTYAESKGLNILQPTNLESEDFLSELKKSNVNLIVVVAFKKLPAKLFTIPEFGTFNLHASLLPNYRGAAPIQRAIMNGETETGATTFFIDDKIDTGKVILQRKTIIGKNENAGSLHDRLMLLGADLVLETVKQIESGNVKSVSQSDIPIKQSSIKSAKKIYKADCKINWSFPAPDIHNHVRGLSPYPAAFTTLLGPDNVRLDVKILSSDLIRMPNNPRKAILKTDGKNYLKIDCEAGEIFITVLQTAGKKALKIEDWLRGTKINNDWRVD